MTATLLLVVLSGEEMLPGAVGYVVSVPRRRVRRAVVRNRVRRLLREALRVAVRRAEEQGKRLPFAAVGLVWRAAGGEELRRLRLAEVVAPVEELLQQAVEEGSGCASS